MFDAVIATILKILKQLFRVKWTLKIIYHNFYFHSLFPYSKPKASNLTHPVHDVVSKTGKTAILTFVVQSMFYYLIIEITEPTQPKAENTFTNF